MNTNRLHTNAAQPIESAAELCLRGWSSIPGDRAPYAAGGRFVTNNPEVVR